MSNSILQFPAFLEDYGSLYSHLTAEFEGLSSNDKGDFFADFSMKLASQTECGMGYISFQKRKKSHDKGVDITAVNELNESSLLAIQSKLTLPSVEEFDSIISKFRNFESEIFSQDESKSDSQLSLLELEAQKTTRITYMIITASDLRRHKDSGILRKYERSQLSSLSFYKILSQEKRIHIIDGHEIWKLLRAAYRKEYFLPSDVNLNFVKPFIEMNDVYIGIVKGNELKEIYDEFGNALFFENIREYLGQQSGLVNPATQQLAVNKAITDTVRGNPSKFLARNNGITIRAGAAKKISGTCLSLDEASIINGCQTTMSLVYNPSDEACVVVKIVVSQDSWDIAEAANFQNEIRQVDLRLARYIRPQAIKAAAGKSNVRFDSGSRPESAYAILETIYQSQVSYEEVKSLFLGLFSLTPANTINNNYTKLRTGLIEEFYSFDPTGENVFDILFKLHRVTQKAAVLVETMQRRENIKSLFNRFWQDSKPQYRALLAIVAACGCLQEEVMYSSNEDITYTQMQDFLTKLGSMIDNKPQLFFRYYSHAFTSVALQVITSDKQKTVSEMLQVLHNDIKRTSFEKLYMGMCLAADNDIELRQMEESMQ
jgi:hypothetical protein